MGEEVYYKRDDNNKWRGSGRVLGKDGPAVFARHGSRYVKAHICHGQPASSSDIAADNTKVGDRNYPKLNSVVKSLHFILAQSGNFIIATACPLKSS